MQSHVKKSSDRHMPSSRASRLKTLLKPEAPTNPLYHGCALHNSSDLYPPASDRITNFRLTNEDKSKKCSPETSYASKCGVSRRVMLSKHSKHDTIHRLERFNYDHPRSEERPKTLPLVAKKHGKSTNLDLPQLPRISRQEIINRRTSFQYTRSPYITLRRKSNSLLENRLLINEQKDNKVSRFPKASNFLKNQTLRNPGRNNSNTLERRTSGSRSVVNLSTATNTLSKITHELSPKSSTLPKIINSRVVGRSENRKPNLKLKESANREAPIYGRIRRRQLSLPNVPRACTLSDSTHSLKFSGKQLSKPNFQFSFEKQGSKSNERYKRGFEMRFPKEKFSTNGTFELQNEKLKTSSRQSANSDDNSKHDCIHSILHKKSVTRDDSRGKILKKNPWNSQSDSRTWHNFRANKAGDGNKKNSDDCANTSRTLPLYTKSARKSSNWGSSGIPLKIASRGEESKKNKSSKFISEQSNLRNKWVASHSRSLSDINSNKSNSPTPSSSIFGFCTGRRKVQIGKKNDGNPKSVLKKKVRIVIIIISYYYFFH